MSFLQEILSDKVSTGRNVVISDNEFRYTVLLLMTCIFAATVLFMGLVTLAMIKEIRR